MYKPSSIFAKLFSRYPSRWPIACATLVAILAALVPLASADSPALRKESPSVVQALAKKLQGRWQLESRMVGADDKEHRADAHHLKIFDIRTVSATEAKGKVLMLESGTFDRAVESPELFEENPELIGKPYTIGGFWDITLVEEAEPRCPNGVAAVMRFEGESEGSYGIFKYGCVKSANAPMVMCQMDKGQFEMVGIAPTDSGVEGVMDVWTAYEVGNDGKRDYMIHELPREDKEALLRDTYFRLDEQSKLRQQTVEGLWVELIENKTLIMAQLDVRDLLAAAR